jgi:dihydrolipoamide dehydrogenase
MAVGSSNSFDLVVLGAGTGGYTAAFRAAQLGLKVALVDEDKIGGTCLHRGCIPAKALLESAGLVDRLKHGKEFGIVLGAGDGANGAGFDIDYPQMAARKDQVVKRMWTGLKTLVDKNKVAWIPGRGRLEGPNKIRVSQPGEDGTPGGGRRPRPAGDGRDPRDRQPGEEPARPDRRRDPDPDERRRPERDQHPEGHRDRRGGRRRLRVRVDVPRPRDQGHAARIPAADRAARGSRGQPGAGAELQPARDHGHDERPLRHREGPDHQGRHLPRRRARGQGAPGDPGGAAPRRRRPATNIEEIGLETTKVETDRGFVKVDGRMRTKEPHVYAIGDVVGGLMLAHTAGHEGIVAAHTIAGDKDVHPIDYVKQPRATYCRPEIASIGLTQQQCEERGLPIKVGKVPFQAIAKALIGGEYEGFAKVIANKETDETLGIHLIGPHATDLIAEASVAFELEAVPWEIGGATHAHPTLSEVLGEASMAVDGRSINF